MRRERQGPPCWQSPLSQQGAGLEAGALPERGGVGRTFCCPRSSALFRRCVVAGGELRREVSGDCHLAALTDRGPGFLCPSHLCYVTRKEAGAKKFYGVLG